MAFETLTTKNTLLYATRMYDNPECVTTAEFLEDYKRFKYVKRLCRRYVARRPVSERLLLNHIIALLNVFGPEATVRLMFVKCDDSASYGILKTFLVYLNVCPDVVTGINGFDILTADIPINETIAKRLQEL